MTTIADTVTTLGADSDGMELVALNGPITLNANLIDTAGDFSDGAILNAAGDINLDIGVLRTAGGQALGLNLTTAPLACVALGAGSCTIQGTIGELTTQGDGSIGALINAAGPTALTIDVLQTGGNDAAGIDLTTNPTACAVLGSGNCGTDFTIGNLLTLGDDSPGILAAIAGPTALNITTLETNGDNSPGIAIIGDPSACVLLGSGACNTNLTVGDLLTTGDGSGGLAVDVPAFITANLGTVVTQGDDAPAIALRADPAACAILGTGSCGIDLTATQVTTGGANAPAVGIAAVGPISVDLGSVSTAGINSPAVSIAADPAVCAVLGAAECVTDVSVGSITTTGDGSTGLGVLAGGPVTINTGPISTLGTQSDGISLTVDPAACIIAGAALCTTTATTGPVSTGGDGSAGIGISAAGPVVLDIGDISTLGTNAPGLAVSTDPAVCAIIGSGACSTQVTTGSIITSGDGSPGIGILAGGPTTVTTGPVTTGGAHAPGITVTTDPTACLAVGAALCTTTVSTGPVNTGGDNSPGVVIEAGGPTTITTGPITTTGNGSDGLVVTLDPTLCLALGGSNCTTTIETGPIDTGGSGSGGVVVGDGDGGGTGTGGAGTVTIVTGPITSDGDGVGVDVGCTQVNYTASGPVTSANGTGIRIASACGVNVTTLEGAPVQGATGGIDVTSGTGSVITIGDRVSSDNGLAINVDGAATTLVNQSTGVIVGRIDLTDADDRFDNGGRLEASGNSSFGAGNDLLNNAGTIAIRPGATTPGAVRFDGLETLNNSGLIDMRNGQVGDTLTVPGTFVGSGGSTLGVDVGATNADRLVIGGAASGRTSIVASGLNGQLVGGTIVVDAGAGTNGGAFTLGGQTSAGIVDYFLVYDGAANDFALYGTPNQSGVAPLLLADGARQAFYRSNDAVSAHLDAASTGRAFWIQGYGLIDKREGSFTAAPFGQQRSYSLDTQQDFYGAQMGADIASSEGGTVLGVTAGYGNSRLKALSGGARFRYDTFNAGVYGKVAAGGFRLEGLAKYERVRVRYTDGLAYLSDRLSADGFGGYVKASMVLGTERFSIAPFASLDYANIDFKSVDMGLASAALDEADGLRGKAGARVDTVVADGPSRISIYASGAYVHEFKARDRMALAGNGYTLDFRLPSAPDYGQARLGVAINQGSVVSGFIEATGDFSGSYHGGGARGGLSIHF